MDIWNFVRCICAVFLISDVYGISYSSISDWGTDWALLSGRVYQPKCMPIPRNLTLCQNIGYDKMRLPNLLEHDTITEVTKQAGSWVPLLGLRCHPNTQLFLCSLFSPVCLESDSDRLIWPCRSLCEAVKAGCEQRMLSYRFPWPEMLRCDKFPEENDLCIRPLDLNKHNENNECRACSEPDTYEGIIDNYCRADFVLRVKIKDVSKSGNKLVISTLKKKKFYKKSAELTKAVLRKFKLQVEGANGCDCKRIKKGDTQVLMGKKVDGVLTATYAVEWPKKRNNPILFKNLRKALRKLKKMNLCKGGLEALGESMDVTGKTTEKKNGGKKSKRKLRSRKSGKKKADTAKN